MLFVVTVAVFLTVAVLVTVVDLRVAAVTVALAAVAVCVVAVAVVIAIVVIIVVAVTVAKAKDIVFVINLIAGGVAAAVNIAVFALNTNIIHTRLKELTKTNVLNYKTATLITTVA